MKNLSVLQSLKGKSKGFSTATAEVMDICGAGGTASKFTEKMPLDPKRKGNCSSSKKRYKNSGAMSAMSMSS